MIAVFTSSLTNRFNALIFLLSLFANIRKRIASFGIMRASLAVTSFLGMYKLNIVPMDNINNIYDC